MTRNPGWASQLIIFIIPKIGEQPNNPALLSMVFAFAKTFQTDK